MLGGRRDGTPFVVGGLTSTGVPARLALWATPGDVRLFRATLGEILGLAAGASPWGMDGWRIRENAAPDGSSGRPAVVLLFALGSLVLGVPVGGIIRGRCRRDLPRSHHLSGASRDGLRGDRSGPRYLALPANIPGEVARSIGIRSRDPG